MNEIITRPASTLGLILSSFAILIALGGGLLWVRSELENHRVRIERNETDLRKMSSSDENTKLEERIHRLEVWTTQAPPLWFREMFNQFRLDLKSEMSEFKNELIGIESKITAINLFNKSQPDKNKTND